MEVKTLEVVYQSVGELIPYVNNARTHSDEQVLQITSSIKEFGFNNPILTDGSNGILAGHGRLLAAKKLGMERVPTVSLSHLSEPQKRAYILADNKIALNAGWDNSLLKLEFDALTLDGIDTDLTGFSLAEIKALEPVILPEPLTDEDEIPPEQEAIITAPGDVWILGNHRIMCGDSTDAGSVALLMHGRRIELLFTSPPYGQQREYDSGGIGDWNVLMNGVFGVHLHSLCSEDAQILVNLGLVYNDGELIPYYDLWIECMRDSGWRRFGQYVWDQGCGLPGDWSGRFAPSYEFVFHFNKKSIKLLKNVDSLMAGKKTKGKKGLRGKDGNVSSFSHATGEDASYTYPDKKIPDSVIRENRQCGGVNHPAPFSVNFAAFVLSAFPFYSVYDPFCGSGTTIIAAEKTGRKCFGMEISPKYVDVIVRRWQNFTGKEATLESYGTKFNDR